MPNIYRPFPGDITKVHGIRIGQAQNAEAQTGVTVILAPAQGATGGVSVRGAAPGTRETDLLKPGNLVEQVHAVVLSGGSAYGLAAADGVMNTWNRWASEWKWLDSGCLLYLLPCCTILL